jgi:hypothetical protein
VPLPRPVAKILPGLDPKPAEGSPGTTRVNILILGVDRRPHHDQNVDGPPNADSIHILSLDPVTKTATALSLPRDLYVEAPSPEKKGQFIETRVNQTFKLGRRRSIRAAARPTPSGWSSTPSVCRSTTTPSSIGSRSPT